MLEELKPHQQKVVEANHIIEFVYSKNQVTIQ